jgi:uncharacterized protein (DUF924 family)
MTGSPVGPDAVLAFWRAAGADKWFTKDEGFDADVLARFGALHAAAAAGKLADWATTPEGTLALLIVLDQFPRNLFRGDPRTYATDPLARAVAQAAIACGADRQFAPADRQFFYLPFMHSEDLADQERAVALYEAADDPQGAEWARMHADVIRRFGRFPHRNSSTAAVSPAEGRAPASPVHS